MFWIVSVIPLISIYQFTFPGFEESSMGSKNHPYYSFLHIVNIFRFDDKVKIFVSFSFTVDPAKSSRLLIHIFLLKLVLVFWSVLEDFFVSERPREFYSIISLDGFCFVHARFLTLMKYQFLVLFLEDSRQNRVTFDLGYFCYYYYYFLFVWYFVTPALAGGLSVESEWQQISSRLLDPS